MATCVSCYRQHFENTHRFAYDLQHLGFVYREYAALMQHWQRVLPNPIHIIDYEAVVSDLRGRARELIEFLQLDWDPRCLAFHDNPEPVTTASFWQARQPLYRHALDDWKHYQPWLQPLRDALAT